MKRPLTDSDIVGALENLAARYPWDECDIWVDRKPEGQCRFTARLHENDAMGWPSAYGNGDSPMDAVNDLAKDAGLREPEAMRDRKIAQLEEQLRKLRALVVGIPPYKPGTYLTNGSATVEAEPATVETL